MATTTSVGSEQGASPPEPALTAEELIARAQAIAPTLVERQAETEQRTFYAEDTHEEFRKAGFYRILVPRKFGGYEFDIETFLSVAKEIATGCPSTGWMLCLGTSHALTVGTVYEERPQAEIFAAGDFICPTTVKPQGRARRAADRSWIVDGVFNFCSGAPYGTHYMGHAFPNDADTAGCPPAPMLFTIARDQWERLDDWGVQTGLKGSGSHSIKVENGHVPEHWALPNTGLMNYDIESAPGERVHGNPMYAGSSYSFFMLEAAAVATGIATGAVQAFGDLMVEKQTPIPPFMPRTEDPDYQRWYGTAAGKVAAADAMWRQCAQQWTKAARDHAFTPELDMTLVRIGVEVQKLGWDAMADVCARMPGSTSMRTGERIERIWRDMSTVHAHNGIVFFGEMATRALAMAHFGVAPSGQ
jgi:3-hydroxy-9,10-secoandrosta-1,3,5(10)-triene-9,17-dione monooxygenase